MNRLAPWCAGFIVLVLLATACLWDYYPPLASTQDLQLEFRELRAGPGEPLIVTGEFSRGEFLTVRPLDARTVVFGYDKWGSGGPESVPITVEPHRRYTLRVELPALQAIAGNPFQPGDRVRVSLDDRVVLEHKATPHTRRPMRAWFARNPIGGSSCVPELVHAQLFDRAGRPLIGGVRDVMRRAERLRGWLNFGRWQVAVVVLLSIGAAWAATGAPPPALRWLRSAFTVTRAVIREHRLFVALGSACTLLFAWLISYGTFQLKYPDVFGDFYDYQATSLLAGRLDVPEAAISGEAFVHGGKIYGYFGPTPALLRLPFTIFNVGFGELTRASMVLAFAGVLAGAYLFFLEAARQLRPESPRPSRWPVAAFLVNAALGNTVFYLGSRAYVYHEAILWGITFAMFACWCGLRWLAAPASRWWLGALACGVLSVHARPPAGLFALTFAGGCALLVAFRSRPQLRLAAAVAVLSVTGVLSFNALSFAKFRTFDGCPLRLNVQYDAKRLARIDGKQFHLSNLPFNTYTYLVELNLTIRPQFPWFYIGDTKPYPRFPAAKIDLPDRTLALPFSMTGLCFFGVLSWAFVRRGRDAALLIAMTWAAVVPMTLAMFAAIATSQRYTGDFCPFLICAAALGVIAFGAFPRRLRVAFGALAVIGTLWAVVMTIAATLHHQGAGVWGAPPGMQERYQHWQTRVDTLFRGDQRR